MGRTLKLWNGNGQSIIPSKLRDAHKVPYNGECHVYAAAYSRADLCRMLIEWGGRGHGLEAYIRDYWSAGLWGNAMAGITPERGIWVQYKRDKPVREA